MAKRIGNAVMNQFAWRNYCEHLINRIQAILVFRNFIGTKYFHCFPFLPATFNCFIHNLNPGNNSEIIHCTCSIVWSIFMIRENAYMVDHRNIMPFLFLDQMIVLQHLAFHDYRNHQVKFCFAQTFKYIFPYFFHFLPDWRIKCVAEFKTKIPIFSKWFS